MVMPSSVRTADGQFDFSAGVDSSKVPTIQSDLTPNGLKRNQVSWLKNATCRGGSISPRPGFRKLCRVAAGGLYQGGYCYDASARNFADNPYLMLSIDGHIYQVRVDTNNAVVDLSTDPALLNPPLIAPAFMCQGEEFLVIQAGDYTTLPLFFDGVSLRRSVGLAASGGIGGCTFVVPAVGAPVLVNLTAPYSGGTNQVFVIDGYHYQQIENTNRYTHHYYYTGGPTVTDTYPAGSLVNGTNFTTGNGVLLAPVTGTVAPIPSNQDAYVSGGPFIFSPSVGPPPQVNFVDGVRYRAGALVSNPLALPGANQVWLLNLDDPRITSTVNVMDPNLAELPSAGPMDYYMGRIWYSLGREYCAGDIVGGVNGSGSYNYRDSILKVTENPIAIGGDGFSVESNSGLIEAIRHPANLDAALGQGPLYIFTPKTVHKLEVPVTRANWIAANLNNQPLQTVAQDGNGAVGERSIVSHNGDLFYQSQDGVRSLITALRYFGTWGNVPISNNEARAVQFNDPVGMRVASGVVYDNRLLECCLPFQTASGVVYKGLLPLDFDLISTLQDRLPPAWEGMWEGLQVLQLFTGIFSGAQRCFAVTVSETDGGIDVWEIVASDKTDDADKTGLAGDKRVVWYTETPAWTWQAEFNLKELDGGEIWVDRVVGTCDIEVLYRVDADPCWNLWHRETICSARSTCEDCDSPTCYPEQPYGEGYKFPITLPKPTLPSCPSGNKRPSNQGYQFQVRVAVRGFLRIRGWLFYSLPLERAPHDGLNC